MAGHFHLLTVTFGVNEVVAGNDNLEDEIDNGGDGHNGDDLTDYLFHLGGSVETASDGSTKTSKRAEGEGILSEKGFNWDHG